MAAATVTRMNDAMVTVTPGHRIIWTEELPASLARVHRQLETLTHGHHFSWPDLTIRTESGILVVEAPNDDGGP